MSSDGRSLYIDRSITVGQSPDYGDRPVKPRRNWRLGREKGKATGASSRDSLGGDHQWVKLLDFLTTRAAH